MGSTRSPTGAACSQRGNTLWSIAIVGMVIAAFTPWNHQLLVYGSCALVYGLAGLRSGLVHRAFASRTLARIGVA
jgi:hypothetical protein